MSEYQREWSKRYFCHCVRCGIDVPVEGPGVQAPCGDCRKVDPHYTGLWPTKRERAQMRRMESKAS